MRKPKKKIRVPNEALSRLIKEKRDLLKVTQKTLGNMCGLYASLIQQCEQEGRLPRNEPGRSKLVNTLKITRQELAEALLSGITFEETFKTV